MEKDGILVVGSANMDLVVTTERYPQPGETLFGKNFQMFPGGKGANQAVAAARLGIETTFIGKLGKDDFGTKLVEVMSSYGVKPETFTDSSVSTGTAFIIVDENGQNEIIVISGSNMNLKSEDILEKKDLFKRHKVILTQLEIPLEIVLKTAVLSKENGSIFILNPAPACDLPENLYSMIDFITPNEMELQMMSGVHVSDSQSAVKAANILLKRGVKNVIVTLGKEGALLINSMENRLFKANKVKAVDTTAAGDAFNGAVAFCLAKGHSIEDAIEFANKAAAISVTRMGAQTSMPDYQEVINFSNEMG